MVHQGCTLCQQSVVVVLSEWIVSICVMLFCKVMLLESFSIFEIMVLT